MRAESVVTATDPPNLIWFVPAKEAGRPDSTPPGCLPGAALSVFGGSSQVSASPDVRVAPIVALLLAVAVLASACSGGGASPSLTAPPTAAPTTAATSPPTAAATSTPVASVTRATVRLALDWTPNTNHTGFFVAAANGWYDTAGIELAVLPYTGTSPETLLAAGQADCGISFQDALTFAVAAGAPIVSVMAILQHTAQEIAVLAAGDIERPRDLDGKTYGGFGYPNEEPTVRAVIQNDGGRGTFNVVTLNAAVYEALFSKQVDFAITFTAWEGIEATQRGIALRTFKFTDYGFPDFYQVVLACNTDWLLEHVDIARTFLAATVRGCEFAHEQPAEAAALLIAENLGVFDANPDLPRESAAFLAAQGLYVDVEGRVGRQTTAQWAGYSGFLYDEGLLVDGNGRPLTAPPDYAALYTNAYLP